MYYSSNSVGRFIGQFMYKVYAWMALGLLITAGVAYYIAQSPHLVHEIAVNPWYLIGIFIFQMGLVLALSLYIMQMNFMVALSCFMLYAISLGLLLSPLFIIYTQSSIYLTFIVTAGMFGIMALYGYFTQSDLTSIGSMCTMALFGLILAFLVNIYFKSSMFDLILSGVGVVIFSLLTAYDVQKIKGLAQQCLAQGQPIANIALLGAFTLYLDFVNLFLLLLRFTGQQRRD